jgi:outer membrane protein
MKKLVLFLACAFVVSSSVSAQVKFGYIDSRELLSAMPEKTKADSSLQLYAKSFQDQLTQMQKEYEKKLQDFQAQEKTMTDAIREVKIKEIQDLQNRMESTNQSAQEKVEKKRQDMYSPILEKADKAIKAVAAEKAYDYIFDASSGAILHAKETDNILPLVKAKLGIK